MRIGYLECFSGISGDMLLGALVDAGVPLSHLQEATAALNVGARLEARKVMRGGITATKVDVITAESEQAAHEHPHGDAHTHSHDQAHSHGHEHTHSHEHEHTHSHEHEHTHSHAHEGGLVHSHAHTHSHLHEHRHPHEYDESSLHERAGGHELTGVPDHEHGEEHGAYSHAHLHDHAHGAEPESGVGQAHPHTHDGGHEHHRSLSTILGIIARAELTAEVKARASRAFQMLGEAEAAIHSIDIEKVHFHEVGAVDTIVDIVCAAAGAAWLGVERWLASPLNVGSGTVVCAHGTLPVPAPATLKLLGDAPVYAAGPAMERVTPTGATILRMLEVQYAALPAMRVGRSGYGAGGRDTPGQANVLRLLAGEESAASEAGTEPIAIVETVIDDSTPQVLAYVSELLLAAGAWDVYRVAVQMKKGRTGTQLTVLASPELVPVLRDLLFRETTTIGVHWRVENKIALKREFAQVDTGWGPVRIKVARWPSGEVANATPEYEDCRKIAAERGVPLKQVLLEAARLYAMTGNSR